MRTHLSTLLVSFALVSGLAACGDDNENQADALGVGAQCTAASDCLQPDPPCDGGAGCFPQQCLTQFAGGYCGIVNCTGNADCPAASVCVAHTDGLNYCFRACTDKAQCNVNRAPENESNCSSSIDFVDPATTGKACVPPSSGL